MKLTVLSIALIAAIGMTSGCGTHLAMQSEAPVVVHADAEAQYALGRYYQGQQRYDQAIDAYRNAVSANPAHAAAYNGLGASLLLAGQHDAAIEQFKAGLRVQPRSAALWNNLGYAYMIGGENSLAQMALKQALDLDPADTRTNSNLAMATEAAGPPASPALAPPVLAAATVEVVKAQDAAPEPMAAAGSVAAQAADTAEPAVTQVVQVAPRVYELNLPDERMTRAAVAVAQAPVAVTQVLGGAAGETRVSVPLRASPQAVALNNEDFVLEIRNGNGVRHMALHTSQYLAQQGYATKRLSNQPGFNVATTRVFYLPGYQAEAERLLAHLPGNTTMSETLKMRSGIHVRVVLGRDMARHQAATFEQAPERPLQLAALAF